MNKYIPIQPITLFRLLDLHPDALSLYMLYVKNVILQKTRTIKATTYFCKKGLIWGDRKFIKAKNILVNNGFIELKDLRKDNGHFTQYIVVNYINIQDIPLHPSCQSPCTDESGHGRVGAPITTVINASNKHINANNKKVNANNKNSFLTETIFKDQMLSSQKSEEETEAEKIFNLWNSNTVGLPKHISILSKLSVGKNWLDFTPTIKDTINHVLAQYSFTIIYKAMKTYFKALELKECIYTYKFKSLSDFLESKKGLIKFTDETFINKILNYKPEDVVDALRKQFTPITTKYNPTSVLSTELNTYYGFRTEELNDIQYINELIHDIKAVDDGLSFGYLNYLEKSITSLLFRRKHIDITELLIELMAIWVMNKDKYEEAAKKYREESL